MWLPLPAWADEPPKVTSVTLAPLDLGPGAVWYGDPADVHREVAAKLRSRGIEVGAGPQLSISSPATVCKTRGLANCTVTVKVALEGGFEASYELVRSGGGPGATTFAARSALRDAVDQAVSAGPFDPVPYGEVRDGPPTWTAPWVVAACPEGRVALPRDLAAVMAATVTITSDKGSGSGVVVSRDGVVLTAAHVLDDDAPLEVVFASGEKVPARVIRVDRYHDVAVLDIDGDAHACAPAALAAPAIGAELFVVGSPLGTELSQSVSKGIVSGVRTIEGWKFLQTDASINPGNSGGPLFDPSGHVIGVVDWKVRGAEGLGFGVPIEVVAQRLGIAWGTVTDAAPATGLRGRVAR